MTLSLLMLWDNNFERYESVCGPLERYSNFKHNELCSQAPRVARNCNLREPNVFSVLRWHLQRNEGNCINRFVYDLDQYNNILYTYTSMDSSHCCNGQVWCVYDYKRRMTLRITVKGLFWHGNIIIIICSK